MPRVIMTNKQTAAVRRVVCSFIDRSRDSPAIPDVFKVQCQVIMNLIDEGHGFEPYEFDSLIWLLDLYFEAFEYEDIDPYAEQAYAKLKGHWPFDVPPYDRQRDCGYLVGHSKGNREPHLGT